MANPEHLEILKQGVGVWNEWRARNPNVAPDLRGLDLHVALLIRINFSYANLLRARITNSELPYADFTGAFLKEVTFRETTLAHTSFKSAVLTWTDFSHADLSEADFSGADVGWTTFGDNDLSEITGLDTANHLGPSILGIETLYRSKGKIPEIFLRGCGVSDEFITFAHSLVEATHPTQFYSCFISYSSRDQDFASRLYADLQNKGVRCWFAPEDIKIGDKFRTRIDESIRIYDKLLLVLSESSVSSQWVEKEVETAMEREQEQNKTMLFPVSLDNAVNEMKVGWPADVRRTRHIGDFTRWKDHDSYQKAFDRLLRDLKAEDKKH